MSDNAHILQGWLLRQRLLNQASNVKYASTRLPLRAIMAPEYAEDFAKPRRNGE